MNISRGESELRRRNIRLAWILAGLALFFFATSFPFWFNLFKVAGNLGQ